MPQSPELPRGQVDREDFPRFGLAKFALRFPTNTKYVEVAVRGDVANPLTIRQQLAELPRVEQMSDLHCETTWTRRSLHWSGFDSATSMRRSWCLRRFPEKEPILSS